MVIEPAIVLHNSSTDDVQIWFMDGPQIKGRNGVIDESGDPDHVSSPWSIAGVTGSAADSAIVLHNSSTDDVQIWFMDGPQIKAETASSTRAAILTTCHHLGGLLERAPELP